MNSTQQPVLTLSLKAEPATQLLASTSTTGPCPGPPAADLLSMCAVVCIALRDIKPENILIMDDVLKLADFGSCRGIYSKQPYTEYISTRWCATAGPAAQHALLQLQLHSFAAASAGSMPHSTTAQPLRFATTRLHAELGSLCVGVPAGTVLLSAC